MAVSAARTTAVLSFLWIFSVCTARSTSLEDYENDFDRYGLDEKMEGAPRVEEDITWPGFPYLKQVSGVAVDGDGNLHVFHRGDRVWDAETFGAEHHLTNIEQGPIPNDTVMVIDTTNGKILHTWGANRFYMPHGLTVDRNGNTWVTDVGLHQVMKFPAREDKPELTIGEAFTPGTGMRHFCKPTDVAVTTAGYFFISDGYCNSRILMFEKGGRYIKEFGMEQGLTVPHSLALVPEHDAVCVADRENGRVLCYATGTDGSVPGKPLVSFEGQGLDRVYGIDTRRKQMFAVNGQWENSQSVSSGHGLVLDTESALPLTLWGPDKGFQIPHDIAVSPDGKYVYVAEVDTTAPKKVYKFNIYD